MDSSDEEFEDVDEDVATPPPVTEDMDYTYNLETRDRVLMNSAGAQLITGKIIQSYLMTGVSRIHKQDHQYSGTRYCRGCST